MLTHGIPCLARLARTSSALSGYLGSSARLMAALRSTKLASLHAVLHKFMALTTQVRTRLLQSWPVFVSCWLWPLDVIGISTHSISMGHISMGNSSPLKSFIWSLPLALILMILLSSTCANHFMA